MSVDSAGDNASFGTYVLFSLKPKYYEIRTIVPRAFAKTTIKIKIPKAIN
jgi:hypothetical protein